MKTPPYHTIFPPEAEKYRWERVLRDVKVPYADGLVTGVNISGPDGLDAIIPVSAFKTMDFELPGSTQVSGGKLLEIIQQGRQKEE